MHRPGASAVYTPLDMTVYKFALERKRCIGVRERDGSIYSALAAVFERIVRFDAKGVVVREVDGEMANGMAVVM